MSFFIFFLNVVNIAGSDKRDMEITTDFFKTFVGKSLTFKLRMILELKKKIIRTKQFLEFGRGFFGLIVIFIKQFTGYNTCQAGRRGDKPLGMFGKKIKIKTRFIIITSKRR